MVRLLAVGVEHSDTSLQTLITAENDAVSIVNAFRDLLHDTNDFQEKVLISPTRESLVDGLQWLTSKTDDLLIFYYSGHAHRNNVGAASLYCRDSVEQNPTTRLSAENIGEILANSSMSTIWIIADCCFAEDVAIGIRSQLSWRQQGFLSHSSAASGILTIGTSVATSYGDFSLSKTNSPFTRSFLLALSGVARVNDSVTPLDLMELIYFEARRLNATIPVLLLQGPCPHISRHLSLPVVENTKNKYSIDIVGLKYSKVPVESGRWIAIEGTRGTLATQFAIRKSGGDCVTGYGFGPATFQLTKDEVRTQKSSVIINNLNLNHHGFLDSSIPVFGILGENSYPSDFPATPQLTLQVPYLDLEQVDLLTSRHPRLKDNERIGKSLEIITDYSADSIEMALFSANAIKSYGEVPKSVDDIGEIVSQQLKRMSANSIYRVTLEILANAPEMPLSLYCVSAFLSYKLGRSQKYIADTLSNEDSLGLCFGSNVWLPPPLRRYIVKSDGEANVYSEWLNWSLDNISGVLRKTPLSSLCASLENDEIIDEGSLIGLRKHGLELTYWLGPKVSVDLLENVLNDENACADPEIILHFGDALRMADHYIQAEHIFKTAADLSLNKALQMRANVGRLSARKNREIDTRSITSLLSDAEDRLSPADLSGSRATAARALFQRANLNFARSSWDAALESYGAAENLLIPSEWAHTLLLLDVWKGQGDVLLHLNRIDGANRSLTKMLDLAAAHKVAAIDPRSHAKLCQFAGDVTRHMASCEEDVKTSSLVSDSNWWYAKALELYSQHGLELGVGITRFRMAQNCILFDKISDAFNRFVALKIDFKRLGNLLWEFKSDVMTTLLANQLMTSQPISSIGATQIVDRAVRGDGLSTYQRAWSHMSLGEMDEACVLFAELGANHIPERLKSEGIGEWLGGEY